MTLFAKTHLPWRPRLEISLSPKIVTVSLAHRYFPRREQTLYACCPLPAAASDYQHRVADVLQALIHQTPSLINYCSASVGVGDVRVKTVSVPRMGTRELRELTSQPAFWHEYLGITVSEWKLWWRRLPKAKSGEVRLLLAAAPWVAIKEYGGALSLAKLELSAAKIEGFDCFSRIQGGHNCACLMDLSGPDHYLISAGDFGVRVDSWQAQTGADEALLDQYLYDAAQKITRALTGHDNAGVVPVCMIVDDRADTHRWSEMTRLLPSHFQISVYRASEWIKHAAAGKIPRRGRRLIPDVNFLFADDPHKRRHIRSLPTGACAALLLVSASAQHVLVRQNDALRAPAERYQSLASAIEHTQKSVSELKVSSARRARFLADIRDISGSHRQVLRLLVAVERSLLPGMWLRKTEFQDSRLRIFGGATDGNLVMRYREFLINSEDIQDVWIKQLNGDEGLSRRYQFVMECQLAQAEQ